MRGREPAAARAALWCAPAALAVAAWALTDWRWRAAVGAAAFLSAWAAASTARSGTGAAAPITPPLWLDALPDATAVVEPDGRVLACNDEARRWGALPGARLEDVVPREMWRQAQDLLDGAHSAPLVSEFTWNSPRGAACVQMRVRAVPGGCLVQVRDLTQQRRLEERVRRSAAEQAELKRLREIDRLRRRLLNTVSHELRTPLTPLRLQVELLRRRLEDDEPAHRGLEVMGRNLHRLGVLVDDLLDVAHLEDGKMRLERTTVDLDALVHREVEAYTSMAAAHGIDLQLDLEAHADVRVDPARLAQVLTNLVTNALKYGRPGGTVRVASRMQGHEAVVEVQDDGIGFAPGKHAELFRPFSQLHDGVERRDGSGLGLYICKGIIEGHGGRIWGRSGGPGQGATFGVAMPAAPRTMLKPPALQVPFDD